MCLNSLSAHFVDGHKNFQTFLILAGHFPRAQKIFSYLEYLCAYAQGKGWFASLEVEVSHCASLLPEGISTFVDIGGNKGECSQEIISRFRNARVFILEPSLYSRKALDDEFLDNQNVCIYQIALSDSAGLMTLYADSPGSGGASLIQRKIEHSGVHISEFEEVTVKHFDEIWRQIGVGIIDLCKIDVEGHELNV